MNPDRCKRWTFLIFLINFDFASGLVLRDAATALDNFSTSPMIPLSLAISFLKTLANLISLLIKWTRVSVELFSVDFTANDICTDDIACMTLHLDEIIVFSVVISLSLYWSVKFDDKIISIKFVT